MPIYQGTASMKQLTDQGLQEARYASLSKLSNKIVHSSEIGCAFLKGRIKRNELKAVSVQKLSVAKHIA